MLDTTKTFKSKAEATAYIGSVYAKYKLVLKCGRRRMYSIYAIYEKSEGSDRYTPTDISLVRSGWNRWQLELDPVPIWE